jgi:hypothetical protein
MQMGSEKAIFMPNNVGPAEIDKRADSTSPLICFIITLNPTLPPVMLQNNISCLPFIGSGVNEYIFSHVSADVQTDLLRQTLSRGAHYTNNKSVSIAWNHMLVWKLLLSQNVSDNVLIFEDNAIINNRLVEVYNTVKQSGQLGHNHVLKLANQYRMKWLGTAKLQNIDTFLVHNTSYSLQKCVCSTRQNFFNAGAYVIDRGAAAVLLDHF